MGPIPMAIAMALAFGLFGYAAHKRFKLLFVGQRMPFIHAVKQRLEGTWRFAFEQEKMHNYRAAGIAHHLIFAGFVILGLRTIILWGRAFVPGFNLVMIGPTGALHLPFEIYELLKDIVTVLVIAGALVFVYYRTVRPMKRMTLSGEGLLILGIIITMMLADMLYDGSAIALASRKVYLCDQATRVATLDQCSAIATIAAPYKGQLDSTMHAWPSPAGSAVASMVWNLSPGALIALSHVGYWTHAVLVLVFLNLLPHSKHFHVVTAIPNVFLRELSPAGRLAPMAEGSEKLMEMVGAAGELADPIAAKVGTARIEHFTWKQLLDFYTCTECGRCSDNCPAHTTGKLLSPKHLTLALRDHLYSREDELLKNPPKLPVPGAPVDENAPSQPVHNLVPDVIHPDVIWACTSCRACEEQCPVLISYVDKIVDMRRNLVMVRGEFPHELNKPFQGIEQNGNPWNLSRMDRAAWADGLDITTMAQKPTAEVLFWVGCAASYDDRAKKIARATASLLKMAEVDFAILGEEENCTGDPARRAGNEFLFAMLAEQNAATLSGYKDQGGIKTIITTCPHCFNTLRNEYPDFGAKFEVIHHTSYLLKLVEQGKLTPRPIQDKSVVYHDSCYLGRYNGVYSEPRALLSHIPGVELSEPEYWTQQRGLCCGAGGAQMFMEEQTSTRVNVKRTLQLLDTGAKTIASACPFCMTMLTDGLKSQSLEDKVRQMDVAELLELACRKETTAPALVDDAAANKSTESPSETTASA